MLLFFQDRWPTKKDIHIIEKYPHNQVGYHSIRYYQCSSYNQDRVTPNLFSKDNDMIPLTLVYGVIEELQEYMDASHLERMLYDRSCTVMHVVRH